MRRTDRHRIARLIDELVDHAHRECPDRTFRLELPTGEAVLLPPHDHLTRCHSLGHLGYFTTVVEPFLRAFPVPSRRSADDLRCWLFPLAPQAEPGPADPDHDPSVDDDRGSPDPRCSQPYSVDLAPPDARRLPGQLWLRPSDPRG